MSFWIGADSGLRYSCCIVRLGFCVRFPYNTCGGAHEATFSFEPRLGHGCGSCSAGGGALFSEVPLAPDERLGAANHAQIPCYPTKGPTDCYRKNANRAHRDPRFHFKNRHTVSFFIPPVASVEPHPQAQQTHHAHTHDTHTHTHTIHTQKTHSGHTRTHAHTRHARTRCAPRATHASRATQHMPNTAHATRHAAHAIRHTPTRHRPHATRHTPHTRHTRPFYPPLRACKCPPQHFIARPRNVSPRTFTRAENGFPACSFPPRRPAKAVWGGMRIQEGKHSANVVRAE